MHRNGALRTNIVRVPIPGKVGGMRTALLSRVF